MKRIFLIPIFAVLLALAPQPPALASSANPAVIAATSGRTAPSALLAPSQVTPAPEPAPAVDPTQDPGAWAKDAYHAFAESNWGLLVSLALAMGLALTKRLLGGKIPHLQDNYAVAAYAFGFAMLGALINSFAVHVPWYSALGAGFRVGLGAALPFFLYAPPPGKKA